MDGQKVIPQVCQPVSLILAAFFVQKLVLAEVGDVDFCTRMPAVLRALMKQASDTGVAQRGRLAAKQAERYIRIALLQVCDCDNQFLRHQLMLQQRRKIVRR